MRFSKLLAALLLCAIPVTAYAQQDVIPKVVNGQQSSGLPIYGTVGNGDAGSVPMPVTISGGSGGDVTTTPGERTKVPLDISTVTTGGVAVTALNAGHATAGGFLLNPIGATIALCINEIGTASGTTSAGSLTCIQPGEPYTITPGAGAISVISSDSSHPFSGFGLQ